MKVFNRGINLYYEIGFSEHSFSELDIKIVITQLNSDLLKIIPYERDNLLVKHNFRCHDSRGNILPYRTILIPILKNTSVFGKGYTQYFLQTDKIDMQQL
jgi:hypothetical protein